MHFYFLCILHKKLLFFSYNFVQYAQIYNLHKNFQLFTDILCIFHIYAIYTKLSTFYVCFCAIYTIVNITQKLSTFYIYFCAIYISIQLAQKTFNFIIVFCTHCTIVHIAQKFFRTLMC